MAFVLILACTPSMVTPVPPLDPNVINTSIVQTAEAALHADTGGDPPHNDRDVHTAEHLHARIHLHHRAPASSFPR
ncbi:MAG: hypothetical protein M0C28_33650 [Candidatus Moduliflexus flocculans]|nr:hypothetical protein [Candidatus Moduliflexus flocculans]